MKKAILTLLFLLFAAEAKAEQAMKIKLVFDGQTVIVSMRDNSASRQFLAMLPATFEFADFAGQEKITEFPHPVSLTDAPRGMVATAGKMFIYAPWGNLGIFYRSHGHTVDDSLIHLGDVENGLDVLANKRGGFTAKITVLD
ncbi:MAG TPA: hypothetical protein DD624_06585 [Alphaproteobacteria bacterium]|nr:hypothetical protein [Alphaproteobacteria bacterium]